MRYLLFILLLMSTNLFAQKVYQWTDGNGNTVFSDKPHPDAKQINVPELPSFESQMQTPSASGKQKGIEKITPSKITYQTLNIISPKNEETVWSNQGVVMVSVDLKPQLASGDKLAVYVDGTQMGETASGNSIELTGVERGTHSIQAKVIDSNDKVIKTSLAVTVYLHKASVNQPANNPPVIINRAN